MLFYKYNSHENSQWFKKIVPRGGANFNLAHNQILACYGPDEYYNKGLRDTKEGMEKECWKVHCKLNVPLPDYLVETCTTDCCSGWAAD